ncbi:cationic amino acid transporter 9, chloroplastic isoform X1 [Vicia villosa]|uniref:cationic amino acid transporter 9, chloroplastic isoform X1 n=1 Tax=Vicia villosa TaxID=3911 RepID=UPI00273AD5DF|nr:cationic amino acid transporter 9, chloroplastic isoform X1 [Vicia villosa]
MGMRSTSPPISSSSSSSSCCSRFWSSALRSKRLVSPAEKAARDSSGHGLSRRLGVFDLILLGIGASIGAGIFVVTGTVAHDAGPGVTISFILAGASCVINALCYAELASRFPAVVGGAYLYTYTAFNELTAFLVFSQLMLDYHIGAASIARSLASYIISFLEIFPVFKDNIPNWIGHGENIGNVLSINALAPVLLMLLTLILCLGVKESSTVNSFMTVTKVIIVIVVIVAGAFEVDVSNWSPFAPHGVRSILTGATVVFFAYVGFDAVANSAEESKKPQRDLPIGIIGSLLVCIALYIGVCLVITGMVPFNLLGEDAPLAEAFKSKGLKFVSILISIGAIAGLTTALLVGLYVQSRLYLGLGRDGLLPALFAKVHPRRHTPINSQIWAGCVASIMAGLLNVHTLSHILSVGTLTGYSVVSACVVVLRWKDKTNSQVSPSAKREGVFFLVVVALSGFTAGLLFRYEVSIIFVIVAIVVAIGASIALLFRQNTRRNMKKTSGLFTSRRVRHGFIRRRLSTEVYGDSVAFSCPGVPIVPNICIFFNMFLFGQLHHEAWVRFVILSFVMVGVYAIYGQYHGDPNADETIIYHEAPAE